MTTILCNFAVALLLKIHLSVIVSTYARFPRLVVSTSLYSSKCLDLNDNF